MVPGASWSCRRAGSPVLVLGLSITLSIVALTLHIQAGHVARREHVGNLGNRGRGRGSGGVARRNDTHQIKDRSDRPSPLRGVDRPGRPDNCELELAIRDA